MKLAVKIIKREKLVKTVGTEVLKKEIEIHSQLSHPHIIKFVEFREDKENFYLFTEIARRGNLEAYRRKKKLLDEDEAFVYFLQTCLAVEYLHKNKIIHRDIKPENILFDENFNIKLCDFGWSDKIMGAESRRQTFCGTLDFMAPEVIRQDPYGVEVDIWALGVLLYELVHGITPFKNIKRSFLRESKKSEDCPINFENHISNSFKDLIQRMLKNNPESRLTIEEILIHPWIAKMASKHKINMKILRSVNKIKLSLKSLKKLSLSTAESVLRESYPVFDEEGYAKSNYKVKFRI